jgi:pectate lyase
MLFLLMICGGMLSVCLGGCKDTILHPYRPIYTDAGTGGTPVVTPDAGVDIPPPPSCPTALVGYATLDGGTTGGGDGPMYTVDSLTQLRNAASMPTPAIIRINGTIPLQFDGGTPVELASDTTVIPVHPGDGLIYGGLRIKDVHNVIVRNLTIKKAPDINGADAITIQAANNVWIDHCDLSSELTPSKEIYDGLVDTVHGSRNITVSWNYFHDHYAVSLVGHTDDPTTAAMEDQALAVTFHHNLYQRVVQGAPRARFGHVHLFSNYYNTVQPPSAQTSSYAIASTDGAVLRIEGNVFEQVAVPFVTFLNDNSNITNGTINDVTNLYGAAVGSGMPAAGFPTNTWKPPYPYTNSFDPYVSVPVIVNACAGPGKVP